MSTQTELLREAADAINGSLPYVSSDPALAIRMLRAILAKIDAANGDECAHENTLTNYNHVRCTDCGSINTDSGWGAISNTWFPSIAAALAASGRKDGAR